MKLTLNTLAPFLALTFLGLAGSTYKFGSEFKARASLSATEEMRAKSDLEAARDALSAVRVMAKSYGPDGKPALVPAKNVALANGVETILQLAMANGVKLLSVTSPQARAGGQSTPIESLFSAVPLTNSNLSKVDINIEGTYENYDGFKQFFAGLADAGIAVQSVSVRKVEMKAALRIYGV